MRNRAISPDEERGSRTITMHVATTKRSVSERSSGAELLLAHQQAPLDVSTTRDLLRERGYDLVERCGHVHATRDAQEWHVCLIADLASMPPSRFLACLNEALTLRVEQSIALSPLTYEVGANVRKDGREPFIKQEVP